jgi:hypothetical protein
MRPANNEDRDNPAGRREWNGLAIVAAGRDAFLQTFAINASVSAAIVAATTATAFVLLRRSSARR